MGFRRYSFQLDSDTFTNGATPNTVELIPFLRTVQGDSDFDHNVNSNPTSNYDLSVSDNWTYNWTPLLAPARAPAGLERLLTFATGVAGSQAACRRIQSGKLDVDYDIYRIPQGLGCSTDGVYPFAVTAYAQFHPDDSVLTEEIDEALQRGRRRLHERAGRARRPGGRDRRVAVVPRRQRLHGRQLGQQLWPELQLQRGAVGSLFRSCSRVER